MKQSRSLRGDSSWLDQGGIAWRPLERMQQKGFKQLEEKSLARQRTPREGQQKGAETLVSKDRGLSQKSEA